MVPKSVPPLCGRDFACAFRNRHPPPESVGWRVTAPGHGRGTVKRRWAAASARGWRPGGRRRTPTTTESNAPAGRIAVIHGFPSADGILGGAGGACVFVLTFRRRSPPMDLSLSRTFHPARAVRSMAAVLRRPRARLSKFVRARQQRLPSHRLTADPRAPREGAVGPRLGWQSAQADSRVLPQPTTPNSPAGSTGPIERRKRLGGLLNFYCRRAGWVFRLYRVHEQWVSGGTFLYFRGRTQSSFQDWGVRILPLLQATIHLGGLSPWIWRAKDAESEHARGRWRVRWPRTRTAPDHAPRRAARPRRTRPRARRTAGRRDRSARRILRTSPGPTGACHIAAPPQERSQRDSGGFCP
jgi:hypothetical protein